MPTFGANDDPESNVGAKGTIQYAIFEKPA
jgi:hypothetical protein